MCPLCAHRGPHVACSMRSEYHRHKCSRIVNWWICSSFMERLVPVEQEMVTFPISNQTYPYSYHVHMPVLPIKWNGTFWHTTPVFRDQHVEWAVQSKTTPERIFNVLYHVCMRHNSAFDVSYTPLVASVLYATCAVSDHYRWSKPVCPAILTGHTGFVSTASGSGPLL